MSLEIEEYVHPTDWTIRLIGDHSHLMLYVPDGKNFTHGVKFRPEDLCHREKVRSTVMRVAFIYLNDAALDEFYARLPALLDEAKRDRGLDRGPSDVGGEG